MSDPRALPRPTGTLHVWTEKEVIEGRPKFGSPGGGWFYGLVEADLGGEQGIALAEILPGSGWTVVEPDELRDPEVMEMVVRDLLRERASA